VPLPQRLAPLLQMLAAQQQQQLELALLPQLRQQLPPHLLHMSPVLLPLLLFRSSLLQLLLLASLLQVAQQCYHPLQQPHLLLLLPRKM
jgi:hypothetical protein